MTEPRQQVSLPENYDPLGASAAAEPRIGGESDAEFFERRLGEMASENQDPTLEARDLAHWAQFDAWMRRAAYRYAMEHFGGEG